MVFNYNYKQILLDDIDYLSTCLNGRREQAAIVLKGQPEKMVMLEGRETIEAFLKVWRNYKSIWMTK